MFEITATTTTTTTTTNTNIVLAYTLAVGHSPVLKFHHRIPGRRIHRPNHDTHGTEEEPLTRIQRSHTVSTRQKRHRNTIQQNYYQEPQLYDHIK